MSFELRPKKDNGGRIRRDRWMVALGDKQPRPARAEASRFTVPLRVLETDKLRYTAIANLLAFIDTSRQMFRVGQKELRGNYDYVSI